MADCLYELCDTLCKGCRVEDILLEHSTKSTKQTQVTTQFWGFIESVPDQKRMEDTEKKGS